MKHQDSSLKYLRAKNRVEKLKRFYNHLIIYMVINSIITGFKISNNLDSWQSFSEELFEFSTMSTWLVWGIILVIHALSVFGFPLLFGHDWEERKIEKLMHEELKSKK